MNKTIYWALAALLSVAVGGLFLATVPALSGLLDINSDRVLAYAFMLIGISVIYFGLVKPHWFIKEIIPTVRPVRLQVSKQKPKPLSLKDDSYFWNLFPYALFFVMGGVAYLLHPTPTSLLVALVCSMWVRLLYKFV